jgi:hypothetical protein
MLEGVAWRHEVQALLLACWPEWLMAVYMHWHHSSCVLLLELCVGCHRSVLRLAWEWLHLLHRAS